MAGSAGEEQKKLKCGTEDSEDESEILEESPCGRWLKRREVVSFFISLETWRHQLFTLTCDDGNKVSQPVKVTAQYRKKKKNNKKKQKQTKHIFSSMVFFFCFKHLLELVRLVNAG